jgi:6-phosphogluconate dehydrogenase
MTRSATESQMQIAMVGLGRMGANMVRRLQRGGHECVVYDRDPALVAQLVAEGATGASSLEELTSKLAIPRVVWVMLPAGDATEGTLLSLSDLLGADDLVIDGGNSHYKDDVRRAKLLGVRAIQFVDVGTSGGLWGLERGYCLMVGGERAAVARIEPLLRTLAPGIGGTERSAGRAASSVDHGYLHCGAVGAGHFVKMVHNGIEYGLMQAYAEGFDILANAGSEELAPEHRYELPLADIAEVWRRGSVITSWLLDLTARALATDSKLTDFSGVVADSGEGRWTIEAAVAEAVPAPVISAALFARFRSRKSPTFADKVLSAMRFGFGGHVEKPSK